MTDPRIPTEDFLPLRPVEFDILLALGDGERHGYAIMQEALRRSEGQLQLEPGTLYRALRRMREAGLVTETAGRGRGSRRVSSQALPSRPRKRSARYRVPGSSWSFPSLRRSASCMIA